MADEDQLRRVREVDELLQRAFLSNPIPMTLTNAETERFVAVNQAFLDVVSLTRADVIGRTSADLKLWPDRSGRASVGDRIAEGGVAGPYKAAFRNRAGDLVPCRVSFRLLRVGENSSVLTVLVPDE